MSADPPGPDAPATAGADARFEPLRETIAARMREGDRLAAADAAYELGRAYDKALRFEDAIDAHLAAFDLRNRLLGADDPRTNASCYEVGELSRVLCRFEEAEYYMLRALDVEGARPRGGDFPALLCNNLAEVYVNLGRYDDAAPLFDSALRLRVAGGGEEGERAWRTRFAIARMRLLRGDDAAAIAAEANVALKKAPEASQSTWWLLLADAKLALGEPDDAIKTYASFLEQVPASAIGNGVSFETWLDVMRGLLVGHGIRQNWAKAIEAVAPLPDIAEAQLVRLLGSSAEVQVGRVVGRLLDIQALWLTALWRGDTHDGPAAEAAFAFVQMLKGLRTRYLRLRQPGDAQVQVLRTPADSARLAELRSKIAALEDWLVQSRLAAPDTRSWMKAFDTIAKRAQLRSLEREAAASVGDLEAMFDLRPLGGASLPEGTAGLEIVFVQDVIGAHLGASALAHRHLGFVIGASKDAAPGLIHFGLAAEIDRAVVELRRSLANDPSARVGAPRPAWARLAAFLGKKLAQPCWVRIEGARDLVVAADGAWAAVPLDLLVTPTNERFGDCFSISGCIRLGEAARRRELVRRGGTPLVLAGPDFDLPRAFTGPRQRPSRHAQLATLLPEGGFGGLWAAADEGAEVARLLGVEALAGVWALRDELLANDSPELMHIATHGFLLPSEREDPFELAAAIGNALQRRTVLDDPLQRSGLAFAGANAALHGRSLPELAGDGIVYASTVQQLDLQRTDLVYLSACRSGLGELTHSDGAHGLRRAFLAAGCRSVVATLWDVPDASARDFAVHFYEGLLAGRRRIDALREARDAVKARHPDDPLHWAGFILDGETGPLRRFSPLADLKVASVNVARWLATDADRETAMRSLAASIVSSGEREDVRTVQRLREALAMARRGDPELADLLARHANLANHLGDNKRAIADYRRAIREGRIGAARKRAFRYNIAKIQQQSGEPRRAVAGYAKVLADAPDAVLRATTLVNRAMAHWAIGETTAAFTDLDAVIADAEAPTVQRWMAHLNRAELGAESDPARSLGDVEAALALDAEIPPAERARARVFAVGLMLRMGQQGRAQGEIEALSALPELDAESREHLRRLHAGTALT